MQLLCWRAALLIVHRCSGAIMGNGQGIRGYAWVKGKIQGLRGQGTMIWPRVYGLGFMVIGLGFRVGCSGFGPGAADACRHGRTTSIYICICIHIVIYICNCYGVMQMFCRRAALPSCHRCSEAIMGNGQGVRGYEWVNGKRQGLRGQ
jgi:hypothetical protein